MRLTEVKSSDLNNYSDWLRSAENEHIFQSVEWAEFKKSNWEASFFFLENEGEVIGSATVLKRNIPFINRPLLYLPSGPILEDYEDEQIWQQFFDELLAYAHKNRAVFIKLDPAVRRESKCGDILKKLGFKPLKSSQGFGGYDLAATIRCDLSGCEEDAYQRIPKKTRYNIRFPYGKGVSYQHHGQEVLDKFIQIIGDAGSRGNFIIRNKEYYQNLMEIFGEDARITMAYYDGQPVAGGLTLVYGNKAWAFAGGQNGTHLHLRSYYGLNWERMKWAKSKGAKWFDLYGIPLNRNDKNKLNGLYIFKKSFGGEIYDFIGEYDLALHRFFYQLWWLLVGAKNLKSWLRDLVRKIFR